MVKHTAMALALVLAALPACERAKEATRSASRSTERSAKDLVQQEQQEPSAPGSASASAADRELTERIREQISADESLSPGAKNVAIDARDGSVTLRGEVKSQEEKERVASIAKQIPGVQSVDNQVEVAS